MNESHDPLQSVKQLRQTLAADKLSMGFFLGAGCPCAIRVPREVDAGDDPLIPDIGGLTQLVTQELLASEDKKASFVALMGIMTEDGYSTPNVEIILSRIRSLRDAAGRGAVRGLPASSLDSLDKDICQVISSSVTRELPNATTPYHALARLVGSYRRPPIELFTTNYDLLIEQALESLRVPFFDGFVGSSRPFFDQRAIEEDSLPPRWSLLWKLHGSMNWRFNTETKAITRSRETADGEELLIHPSHRKYDESRRMPYLVMIDRLKGFLRNRRQPVVLFAIGHSFSDEHLNEAIVESLKANPSAACFALQYNDISMYPMVRDLAKGEANLSVFARDAAIIRRREARWFARPATDASALAGAFEFVDAETAESGGKAEADRSTETPRPCRFRLGDFAHFGHFLDDFAGHGTSSNEA